MRPPHTLVALALLALAGGASAQTEPTPIGEADLDTLVEMLDARSFEVREDAREEFARRPGVTDERLVELLETGDLSPEQSVALRNVLFDRFATRGVGAIGVTFGQASTTQGLVIGGTDPDFPSVQTGLIETGDIIVEVDGVDLGEVLRLHSRRFGDDERAVPRVGVVTSAARNAAMRAVQSLVFSRHPGETIPMAVLRQNEEGELERIESMVPLGDYSSHDRAGSTGHLLGNAFRVRLQRETGVDVGEAADVPRTPDFWPMPSVVPSARMNRASVVGAPTTLSMSNNRLDPYATTRAQDAIRREFERYDHELSVQEAKGAGRVPDEVRKQMQIQPMQRRRVVANQFIVERRGNASRPGTDERSTGEVASPVMDEVVRLRSELASLSERLARATDEPTRTRLRERLDETADAIETLSDRLDELLGLYERRARRR